MPIEIKINDRVAKIEVLQQNDQYYQVKIGDKEYFLDVRKVEDAVYSVIYEGKSINLEMIEGESPNLYKVNTRTNFFDIEVIDPISRYKSSKKSKFQNTENIIKSPMPGRIVNIPVKKGDIIKEGETAIIVSAMKMESEYKAPISGIITQIFVSEGDTIEGGISLLEITPNID